MDLRSLLRFDGTPRAITFFSPEGLDRLGNTNPVSEEGRMTITAGPRRFFWRHQYKIGSRHADIYRLPCADGRGFVVAKVARTAGEHVLQSLRKEYSALVDLDHRAGGALLDSLPRPLLLLEREGVLLLSGVSGDVLHRKLQWQANVLWGWRSDAEMRGTGVAVGKWLRSFHEVTSEGEHGHHHGDYLRELDSNLYGARQLGIAAGVLHQMRDQVEAISGPLNGSLVPTAASHGDFIPQNILVSEGRPGVIDFGNYCAQAPVYRDLAAFLAYVTLLASKPEYCRKTLEALASHFLRGYSRRLDPNLLRVFVLNSILRITTDAPGHTVSARDARRIERLLLDVSNGTCWLAKHLEACRSL